MNLTRKQFLATLVGGGAAAALATACGSPSGGSTADSALQRSCTTNGTSPTISANHGHVIIVTAAEVTAGQDKAYDIRGTADHTHSVTVTAANFATLKSNPNASVMITSTMSVTDGHEHTITLVCL